MEAYQRALIGVGRGGGDAAVLAQAGAVGSVLGISNFDLAHVTSSSGIPAELQQPLDKKLHEDRLFEELEQLRDGCTSWPADARFELFVLEGLAGDQLVKLATQQHADLLCIGRQRDKPLDTLGMAAGRLVHHCPCSVLVVPREPRLPHRRILVPVDFSPLSIEALEMARRLAAAGKDCEVVVQHVYGVPPGFGRAGDTFDEFAASLRGHAERRWNDIRESLSNDLPIPSIRFDLIPDTSSARKPADVIAQTAESLNVDLIVCGAKGHSTLARLVLGSTSEGILKQTTRAVLCLKHKHENVGLLKAFFGEEW